MAIDQALGEAENALRLGGTRASRQLLAGRHDAPALVLLGIADLREGEIAAALARFTAATEADPGHAPAHGYRALALTHTGRVPEAQDALERALTLAPHSFAIRVMEAQYFYRLGFYLTCVQRLEVAIAEGAPDRDAYAAAAELLRVARDRAKGNFARVNDVDSVGPLLRSLWARLRPTRRAATPAAAPVEA